MAVYKIVDKDTNTIVVDNITGKTALQIVKEYELAYASQQHLQLVQVS
jgi:ribosomal protein S24E